MRKPGQPGLGGCRRHARHIRGAIHRKCQYHQQSDSGDSVHYQHHHPSTVPACHPSFDQPERDHQHTSNGTNTRGKSSLLEATATLLATDTTNNIIQARLGNQTNLQATSVDTSVKSTASGTPQPTPESIQAIPVLMYVGIAVGVSVLLGLICVGLYCVVFSNSSTAGYMPLPQMPMPPITKADLAPPA